MLHSAITQSVVLKDVTGATTSSRTNNLAQSQLVPLQATPNSAMTWYVDANTGNDLYAVAGSEQYKYKSIAAAVGACRTASNQFSIKTIKVKAGLYSESNILTTANYILEDGTVITNSSTAPIFSDSSASSVVATIRGGATISSTSAKILDISGTSTVVMIIDTIIYEGSQGGILVKNTSSLTLKCRAITSNPTTNIFPVMSLGNAYSNINIDTVSGANGSFLVAASSGSFHVGTFNVTNAYITITDSPPAAIPTQASPIYLFSADYVSCTNVVIQNDTGDISINIKGLYTNALMVTGTGTNYTKPPSTRLTLEAVRCTRIDTSGIRGVFTMDVTSMADLVTGITQINGGGVTIPGGEMPNFLSATYSFKYLNSPTVWVGCRYVNSSGPSEIAAIPSHKYGWISFTANKLVSPNVYCCPAASPAMSQISDVGVILDGDVWNAQVTLGAQGNSKTQLRVKNIRKSVHSSAPILITNFPFTGANDANTGTVFIGADSVAKNMYATNVGNTNIQSAVHVPSLTAVKVVCSGAILTTNLSPGDPSLSETTSVNNAVSGLSNTTSPLMNIFTHMQLQANPNSTISNLGWEGVNLSDANIVNI